MYVDYNIHRYIGGQVHEQKETEGNKQRSKQGRKEVAKDQISAFLDYFVISITTENRLKPNIPPKLGLNSKLKK